MSVEGHENTVDIYDDVFLIDSSEEARTLDQCTEKVKKLEAENGQLKDTVDDKMKKLKHLFEINYELKQKLDTLETNISSLLKTSRQEINRKNEIIATLRRELENVLHRRTLKLGKRQELEEVLKRIKDAMHFDPTADKKLSIPGGPGIKGGKHSALTVESIDLEHVQTVVMGNNSITCIQYGQTMDPAKMRRIRSSKRPGAAAAVEINSKASPVKKTKIDLAEESTKGNGDTKRRREEDNNSRVTTRASSSSRQCDRERVRSDRNDDHRRSNRRRSRSGSRRRDPQRTDSGRRDNRRDSSQQRSRDNSRGGSRRREQKTPPPRDTTSSSSRTRQKPSAAASSSTKEVVNSSDKENHSKNRETGGEEEATSSLAPDDICDMETNDIDTLLQAKQEQLRQLAAKESRCKEMIQSKEDVYELTTEELELKLQAQKAALEELSRPEQNTSRIRIKEPNKVSRDDVARAKNSKPKNEKMVVESACATPQQANKTPQSSSADEETYAFAGVSSKDFFATGIKSKPGVWLGINSTPHRTPSPRGSRPTYGFQDFTSSAGIASILRGDLVPGGYVSPMSGMIRTPTPNTANGPSFFKGTNSTPRRSPRKHMTATPPSNSKPVSASNQSSTSKVEPPPKTGPGKDAEARLKKKNKELIRELGLEDSSCSNEARQVPLAASLGLDLSSSSEEGEIRPVIKKTPVKAKKKRKVVLGVSSSRQKAVQMTHKE